jgi:hypothetical protein
MFPEFVPDKLMWTMAALATVAVMVSRAHADVRERPAQGFYGSHHALLLDAGTREVSAR